MIKVVLGNKERPITTIEFQKIFCVFLVFRKKKLENEEFWSKILTAGQITASRSVNEFFGR